MTDTAMSLDGKRVVVIGGGSGIGFAVAELARAQHPFSRPAGDLNALREKLLDTMWDEVGVVRDSASIARRGRAWWR